jgi:NAD-reducing hydrogenase large subunit
MTKRILIDPVTRIEGHAKISLEVDAQGRVSDAKFHIAEFRGFEKMCEGRPIDEMPGFMARVCGICPVSHALASSKAGDRILGADVPVAAVKQRRLASYAQILQSHALSFFHLSSPDLLVGLDAPPEQRNVFAMLETEGDLVRRGIRLRQFGQRAVELVGGRKVHPGWSVPGGVTHAFPESARAELVAWLPEAYASMELALSRLKGLFDRLGPEIEAMGDFPSLFMGLVDDEGNLEFYDGHVRLVDSEGNVAAEALDPARYLTYLGEVSEPYTYVKPAFFRALGYPGGMYRVGPLARLNVAKHAGTPKADKELREFRALGRSGIVSRSFHYHYARLIEMVHCVERIEELLADPLLYGTKVRADARPNNLHAVGCCEAPRGILWHDYQVDEDGRVLKANLLIATQQNNGAMQAAVLQAARRFVDPAALTEGMLNRVEAAIRCFDPCLSCSTHALGQMQMSVDVVDAEGTVLAHRDR